MQSSITDDVVPLSLSPNDTAAPASVCASHRDRAGRVCGFLMVAWVLVLCAGCQSVRESQARRHLERGETLMAEDDLQAALAEMQAAAQLDPQLAVVHSKLGAIYRRMGQYEEAIESFVDAVRRNPFSFEDTVNLAQLYFMTQRVRDAVQAYLHAVQLKPDDFDAQLNLGVCHQQMGDYAQAVERFQRAIAINPDRPYAYVNLGAALDSQEKYYEAVRAYKEALERDNRQPLVLVNLANTYIKQDRLKIARQTLIEALEIDPTLAAGHEALGYCLFKLKDWSAAETAYKDALAYDSRLPRSCAGLGSIHMLQYMEDPSKSELRDRAIEQWHRSLELDSHQPRIRKLIARYQSDKPSDPEAILLDEKSVP